MEIERGEIGELSKIREEFFELEDAINNIENKLHTAMELSDLVGACILYTEKYLDFCFDDIYDHAKKKILYYKGLEDGVEEYT